MQIDNVRRVDAAGWAGVAADVTVASATHGIRIEVPDRFGDWLAVTPDAFLAMCAPLAAELGERAIHVEGACPQLVEGVGTALDLLALWYPDRYQPPAKIHNRNPAAKRPSRESCVTASFLSGGVDSLFTLRKNHLTMLAGHPLRVAACINAHWGLGDPRPDGAHIRRFGDTCQRRLEQFGTRVGVDVITVRSDYRKLVGYIEGHRWADAHHGLVFAGVAHALAGRIDRALIASTSPLWTLRPWGSHPLIDHALCSGQLQMIHDGMRSSRLDKVRIVAGWPEAVEVVNVCTGRLADRAARWNCGSCEKCVRTAAGFAACGAGDVATRLLGHPLTAADIDKVTPPTRGAATAWADMAAAFDDPQLSRAARKAVARHRRRSWKEPVRQWAGPLWPVLKNVRGRMATGFPTPAR